MEKRHNYAAAGFLLLGIGAAGRAFLGVPEGVTMAELSLTVLLVIGALLLTRQGLAALVCGLAATALELRCLELQGVLARKLRIRLKRMAASLQRC